MLGIDVNIEIKDTHYPIYFDGVNACVKCGAENSIEMIDKFGSKASAEIHPLDHMRCSKCGALYSIKWVKNKDGEGMHPCAVDPSIARQFSNFVFGKLSEFDKQMGETM